MDIRFISAAETWPLRSRVLRPHQRPDELVFSGDEAPDSLHCGAFRDGQLVGIATVVREALPESLTPRVAPAPAPETEALLSPGAWRLRGMATVPEVRGQGYGGALLRACIAHVEAHGGTVLWCVGRTSALPFYQALGFHAVGDEFESPQTGPHYVLLREVGS